MIDFGHLLNALIQSLPPEGGIVQAPPGSTAETVLIDRPCTVLLGYGVYEYTGKTCLFDVQASDVRIEGRGHGGNGTTLLYGGTTPTNLSTTLIRATLAGYFSASRLCLKFTGENSRACGINLIDPVGFDLSDLFVSHGPGGNSVTGIRVSVTQPLQVPQRGYGRICNYLYTGESPVLPGSRGIDLLGIPGGPIVNIAIEGYANIEQAECGLYATCTAQLLWTGPCFFQGCGVGVKLGPYASSSLFQLARFNQCPVAFDIALTCEDNVLLSPGWETPGMGALVDHGVRTMAFVGSRGPWDLATVPLRTLGSITSPRFLAP